MTRQDILRADDIFGPNIGLLKVKTKRTTQKHVEINIQDIPHDIMDKHGYITLAIDVIFINRILLVITTSCNIHFGMAKIIKELKNNML